MRGSCTLLTMDWVIGNFCKNRFTWFFILAIHFLKTPKTDATGLKYCWYPAPPIISLGRRWFPPCPWLVPSPSTHLPPSSPTHPHPPPWPLHPPTPTEQIYILFLTSCFQGGRSQWQWLVIWICLLCLKFLSNLIPLIPTPPLLLIVCGLPPSPTHGCWRIAMKGSFIHPLSLTPITITTHIHPKDLSLFALSPKKGGR